jgi:hypothetical protein
MSLYVDNDALDGIVGMLAASSAALDGAGESAPSAIDAGDAAPALLGIMARLAENAGQLVVALAAASEAVGVANARYREQDVATADSLDTAWTG